MSTEAFKYSDIVLNDKLVLIQQHKPNYAAASRRHVGPLEDKRNVLILPELPKDRPELLDDQ